MDRTGDERTIGVDVGGKRVGPTLRAALVYAAVSMLLTLGAIPMLDRAQAHIPVVDGAGASAGQA